MPTKTTPKTAPAKRAPRAAKTVAKPASGPRPETLAFAAKVVALRDAKGLAWKEVAAKLGVSYDANGSSLLRRAYTVGGGKTVGVRAAKTAAAKATAARKRPAKATAAKRSTAKA